ncbi:hypothetical protein [Ruegeria sp. HKCCD8929]|uniref:hypothetical protein n=1 Tax=Ruegeria sp. HKCCD8929 TaxID=2683006 RepID=UPI0014891DA7|nr:hypothetical protein [Ruegeria sp. HKCCD8929]
MIDEDGVVNGAEFRLRPHRPDEVGVSVNWLEVFDPDKAHQLSEVRRLYRLAVKKSGRFAELNVGTVHERVAEELESLRIVHEPQEAEERFEEDPSHAEIIGLPPGDSDQAMMIGDLIAECIIAIHPAKDET